MCTYINSIGIHQRLLVKFSYDLDEILSIKFTLVMLLVFVTSGCHNITFLPFSCLPNNICSKQLPYKLCQYQ